MCLGQVLLGLGLEVVITKVTYGILVPINIIYQLTLTIVQCKRSIENNASYEVFILMLF